MKKHLRIATALLVLILAISLTGCENYQAERHQSEEEVIGVVSEKNYTEEETKYGYYYDAWRGKYRWKFKNFPEEWETKVVYEDLELTDSSESLYESVEVGDEVELILTTYYLGEEVQSRRLSIKN